MNDLLDFLNSHGSARKFTDQQISEEQERIIIETGQRSPTSSNLHAYSIVGVRDRRTKDQLAVLCGNQAHISQSSLFLVFCADLYRLKVITQKRGYDFTGGYTEMFVIAVVDAALVACRSLMAAQAMGFGGVMVGGIRNNIETVSEMLELPEFVSPVMGMSLGKPESPPKVKPRLPVEGVYFRDRYDRGAIEKAVAEYDRIIDDVGYLRNRQIKPEDYPDFAGSYSWSEHTARRMSRTEPTTLRPHMKPFLESKGFLKK